MVPSHYILPSSEILESPAVKFMPLHEAAAAGIESGLKEALQEEEEGVASHEVAVRATSLL